MLTLSVLIRNREKALYLKEVRALSSVNDKGAFDILPQHANFISLIKDKIIIHQIDDSKRIVPISLGLLRVWQNSVEVFLGIESQLSLSSTPLNLGT